MKDTINKILFFTIGSALGSFVTWTIVKKKYENISNEEIKSVKETYSKMIKKKEKEYEENVKVDNEEKEYEEIINEKEYTNNDFLKIEDLSKEEIDKPYIISYEQFEEFSNYSSSLLTYYKDGFLTDINNNIIDNVDEIVGEENLEHLDNSDLEVLYVRNDKLKCDYEITLDLNLFADNLYM